MNGLAPSSEIGGGSNSKSGCEEQPIDISSDSDSDFEYDFNNYQMYGPEASDDEISDLPDAAFTWNTYLTASACKGNQPPVIFFLVFLIVYSHFLNV